MDFYDFTKVMDQPSNNIPIAFALPGLLYGIEENTFECIDAVRQAMNRESIDLYCFTWDSKENSPYIALTAEIAEKFPGVNLLMKVDSYNSDENIAFYKRILDGVGVDTNLHFDMDHANFKRVIPLLAYHNIYKWIHWRTNSQPLTLQYGHTLIFKIKPTMVPNSVESIKNNFLHSLQWIIQEAQKQITVPELRNIDHPFDVLYVPSCGSSYVNDIFNFTSPNTFHNIFCSTKEELADKIIAFYLEHMKDYPFKIKTPLELLGFGSSAKYLTLEGSTLTYHLVKNAKKPVTFMSLGYELNLGSYYRLIKNPMYRIRNGKVEVIFDGEIENTKPI